MLALVERRSIMRRVCWRVAFAVLSAGVRTGDVMMSSTAMIVVGCLSTDMREGRYQCR